MLDQALRGVTGCLRTTIVWWTPSDLGSAVSKTRSIIGRDGASYNKANLLTQAIRLIGFGRTEQVNPWHDLDWQAFCYVSGELSSAEQRDFEERLGDDQTAREAVARAVALLQVLAEASRVEKVTIASDRQAGRRRGDASRKAATNRWRLAAWLSAVAAVCLSLILVDRAANRFADHGIGGNSVADAETDSKGLDLREQRALALAWSQARDEFSWDAVAVSTGAVVLLITDEDALDGATDDAGDEEIGAPDWMLAAVAGIDGRNDENVDEN